MAFNITVPWKIHLPAAGSASPKKRSEWARRQDRDDIGAHPTLMKEQDLDHLGALHDAVLQTKKRKITGFLAKLFSRTD